MPSALSHVAGSQQRPQSSSGWLCMACLGTHCASGCLAAQHGPCKIIKICRGLRTCTSARSWSRHTLKLNAHTMSAGLQRRSSASPLHASHASAPQQRPAHDHTVSLPRSSVPPSMSPLCPVSGGQNHVTVTGCPHCSFADYKIALDARGGLRGGAQHLQTTLCVPSTPRASGWRRGTRWSRLASSALERAPAARAGCRTPACARRCCALPARPVHAALHHRCRGRCQPRLPAMPGCRRRPV